MLYTVVIVYAKLMYLNHLAKTSTVQLRKSGTLKIIRHVVCINKCKFD